MSIAGCSSFGMTGVNAHVLLSRASNNLSDFSPLTWQLRRHWPLPLVHPFLAAFAWPVAGHIARQGTINVFFGFITQLMTANLPSLV